MCNEPFIVKFAVALLTFIDCVIEAEDKTADEKQAIEALKASGLEKHRQPKNVAKAVWKSHRGFWGIRRNRPQKGIMRVSICPSWKTTR